eukprot:CAMPEP_0179476336 /NCGR_PEP_ID=MMETSP0799-20121207/55383_1 /TAXON_ID=46947 /ORGANISM="Geminigera cryophila, Strain CCMP2564" /LENGTH=50 /DNA_ID=CAMNT_0021286479 /DNA_START=56 /DNA_END=204 /DNA_ORIENTATION=+
MEVPETNEEERVRAREGTVPSMLQTACVRHLQALARNSEDAPGRAMVCAR